MNSQDATPKNEGTTPVESSIKSILTLLEAQNKQLRELITHLTPSSDVVDADSDRVQLTDKGLAAVDALADAESAQPVTKEKPVYKPEKLTHEGRELTNDEYAALQAGQRLEPKRDDFRDAYLLIGNLIHAGHINDPLHDVNADGWRWANTLEDLIYSTAEIIHQIKEY